MPWNSPVYSAFDKDYNFYWASWKENQHSKNIKENEKVFVVIYDSTVPEHVWVNSEGNINGNFVDSRIKNPNRSKLRGI